MSIKPKAPRFQAKKSRQQKLLLLVLAPLFALSTVFAAEANETACRGASNLTEFSATILKWLFDDGSPEASLIGQPTSKEAMCVGALLSTTRLEESLSPSALREPIRRSGAPYFVEWELFLEDFGAPIANLIEESEERYSWDKCQTRFNLIFVDEADSSEKALLVSNIQTEIEGRAKLADGTIDSIAIHEVCFVDRLATQHEILFTFGRVSVGANREQFSRCLMTTLLAHYGYSNLQAVFDSDHLGGIGHDGRFWPDWYVSAFTVLYGVRTDPRENVRLLGSGKILTQCDVVEKFLNPQ